MGRNVFHDIEDDAAVAANLTARADLMMAIEHEVRERGWTQKQAAEVIGISQPRMSALMTGKINDLSLDALVNMLPALGLAISVHKEAS